MGFIYLISLLALSCYHRRLVASSRLLRNDLQVWARHGRDTNTLQRLIRTQMLPVLARRVNENKNGLGG